VLWIACFLVTASASLAAAGELRPRLRLRGFHRADERLAAHRGQVVLLHFWASWCLACTREIPSLAAFAHDAYPQLQQEGLVLLSVSNDVRASDLARFLAQTPLPFPVFYDPLSALNQQLGLPGLPATLVIGRGGQIQARLLGRQDWQSPAFLRQLAGYLARPAARPDSAAPREAPGIAWAAPGPSSPEGADLPHVWEARHEKTAAR